MAAVAGGPTRAARARGIRACAIAPFARARLMGLRSGPRGAAGHAGGERTSRARHPEGDVFVNAAQLSARLAKYDVAGPRYTSYPTVPYWENTPDESQWLGSVGASLE